MTDTVLSHAGRSESATIEIALSRDGASPRPRLRPFRERGFFWRYRRQRATWPEHQKVTDLPKRARTRSGNRPIGSHFGYERNCRTELVRD